MIWTVMTIEEADYGCEDLAEGEQPKVLVTLTDGSGHTRRLLADDARLYARGIEEGSPWPEDMDSPLPPTDEQIFRF